MRRTRPRARSCSSVARRTPPRRLAERTPRGSGPTSLARPDPALAQIFLIEWPRPPRAPSSAASAARPLRRADAAPRRRPGRRRRRRGRHAVMAASTTWSCATSASAGRKICRRSSQCLLYLQSRLLARQSASRSPERRLAGSCSRLRTARPLPHSFLSAPCSRPLPHSPLLFGCRLEPLLLSAAAGHRLEFSDRCPSARGLLMPSSRRPFILLIHSSRFISVTFTMRPKYR